MKQTINFSQFCDAFHNTDRKENFSYEWKKALFEYLEEYEESTGEEIELDIIALCVEYTEYSSLEELQQNYTGIESFDELEQHTTVLYTGKHQDESAPFVIQDF